MIIDQILFIHSVLESPGFILWVTTPQATQPTFPLKYVVNIDFSPDYPRGRVRLLAQRWCLVSETTFCRVLGYSGSENESPLVNLSSGYGFFRVASCCGYWFLFASLAEVMVDHKSCLHPPHLDADCWCLLLLGSPQAWSFSYLSKLRPPGMAEAALGRGGRWVGLSHTTQEQKPVQETIWKLAQLLLGAFSLGDWSRGITELIWQAAVHSGNCV